MQRIRYGMIVRVCMYVCERERDTDTRCMTQRIRKVNVYSQRRRLNFFTRWEEGALYSHPLSSLSTRHINMGNEEAHKLCVIEYDSMTHTKC